MFLASPALHQGMQSCIKHSLDLIIIANMWKCRNFVISCFIETDNCTVIGETCRLGCLHPNLQAAPIIVHLFASAYHHIDDFTTVPYIGDDSKTLKIIFTTALPDDGPVRPETCRSYVKFLVLTSKSVRECIFGQICNNYKIFRFFHKQISRKWICLHNQAEMVFFSLFHRAFCITKFYLYQLMHFFLSNTKIT